MIQIRHMEEQDIEDVTDLIGQLGYPVTISETCTRFEKIMNRAGHSIFVATEASGKVVGIIHGRMDESLHIGSTCEISAFVVDEKRRGGGIGKKLIGAVESWASDRKITDIWLLSNVTRERAHYFYRRNGYQSKKTAHKFEKVLTRDTTSAPANKFFP